MGDRDVAPEYAACRAFGHAWDFTTVERSGGEWIQGLKCLRCHTQRQTRISARTGIRVPNGNRYSYPEELYDDVAPYKMPKGTGGALTPEERGQAALGFIKGEYDELAVRRRRRKKA